MPGIFLLLGVIILVGFTGLLFFNRTKIPQSFYMIILGLLIGPVFHLVNPEVIMPYSTFFATLALLVILLDSGASLDLFAVFKDLYKAVLFTFIVLTFCVAAIGSFAHYILHWSWIQALILGVISSGTATVTVTALVSKLFIKKETKQLLIVESIFNDLTVVFGIVTILSYVQYKSLTVTQTLASMASSLSIAIVFGIAIALIWMFILAYFFEDTTLIYVFTLGVLFLLYDSVEFVGGSGITAGFVFTILLGNFHQIFSKLKGNMEGLQNKAIKTLRDLNFVGSDITFFIKTFFFVYLGIIFDITKLNMYLVVIAFSILALVIIVRFISSRILAIIDYNYSSDSFIISVIMPRGFVVTVVAFLIKQRVQEFPELNIPFLTELVLFLIFVTTLVSILGAFIYEHSRKSEAMAAQVAQQPKPAEEENWSERQLPDLGPG